MNNCNTDILVLDNCIGKKQQNILESYICSSKFLWGFCEGGILKRDTQYSNCCTIEKGINPPYFSHFFNVVNNSNIVFFQPLFNSIATYYNTSIHILKCEINLLTKRDCSQHHYPHAYNNNFSEEINTAIYYVIDSDGDTYLFDQFVPGTTDNLLIVKAFTPKKGSMVIFDSRRFHSSSSPIYNEKRIVIDVVFKIPKIY